MDDWLFGEWLFVLLKAVIALVLLWFFHSEIDRRS